MRPVASGLLVATHRTRRTLNGFCATSEAGWLKGLLDRRFARLVLVAQANKTARIAWVLLVRGGPYRAPAPAQAAAA